MGNKKIAFFGCKSTTRFLVKSIVSKYKISNIITVSPEKNKKIIIPDYYDLKKEFGDSIDVYQVNRYDLKDANAIVVLQEDEIKVSANESFQLEQIIPILNLILLSMQIRLMRQI